MGLLFIISIIISVIDSIHTEYTTNLVNNIMFVFFYSTHTTYSYTSSHA